MPACTRPGQDAGPVGGPLVLKRDTPVPPNHFELLERAFGLSAPSLDFRCRRALGVHNYPKLLGSLGPRHHLSVLEKELPSRVGR
eukprot:11584662-Alexandrium_andersonii.AAC.1